MFGADQTAHSATGGVRRRRVRAPLLALLALGLGLAPLVSQAPAQAAIWTTARASVRSAGSGPVVLLAAGRVAEVRAVDAPAAAAPDGGTAKLDQVVTNLRNWIVGILAALATLFLTIGGLRYLMAGGDPGEIERAKSALRSAAIGYGLAILAPAIVEILKQLVGG